MIHYVDDDDDGDETSVNLGEERKYNRINTELHTTIIWRYGVSDRFATRSYNSR